jgi:hypothetical protein
MRKLILAATAIGALAVPTAAMAAGTPGTVNCIDGSLAGQTITANVTVPAGATCNYNGTINGNLTVNGHMRMFGGEVTGNVQVNSGGQFEGINYPVTIDKNLTITNPAANGGDGFWGSYTATDQSQDHPGMLLNHVKGNVNFTLNSGVYSDYTWPYLYFGGGTTVDGSVNYSIASTVQNRPAPVNGQGGLSAARGVVVTPAL